MNGTGQTPSALLETDIEELRAARRRKKATAAGPSALDELAELTVEPKRAREEPEGISLSRYVRDLGETGRYIVQAVKRGWLNYRQVRALDKGQLGEVARLAREQRGLEASASYERFQRAKGTGFSEWAKDPLIVTAELVAESMAMQVPGIVGTAAATAAGALAGTVAAPGVGTAIGAVGAGAAAGASSFHIEYGTAVLQVLQEAGINTESEASLKKGFSDVGLMRRARDIALKRGLVIGTFDAITAGIAGKVFGRAGREMAGKALAQTWKPAAKAFAGEQAIQMAGGGGGEALGSLAAGQPIRAQAVFAEVIAEPGVSVPEVAAGILRETVLRRPRPGGPPPGPAPPAPPRAAPAARRAGEVSSPTDPLPADLLPPGMAAEEEIPGAAPAEPEALPADLLPPGVTPEAAAAETETEAEQQAAERLVTQHEGPEVAQAATDLERVRAYEIPIEGAEPGAAPVAQSGAEEVVALAYDRAFAAVREPTQPIGEITGEDLEGLLGVGRQEADALLRHIATAGGPELSVRERGDRRLVLRGLDDVTQEQVITRMRGWVASQIGLQGRLPGIAEERAERAPTEATAPPSEARAGALADEVAQKPPAEPSEAVAKAEAGKEGKPTRVYPYPAVPRLGKEGRRVWRVWSRRMGPGASEGDVAEAQNAFREIYEAGVEGHREPLVRAGMPLEADERVAYEAGRMDARAQAKAPGEKEVAPQAERGKIEEEAEGERKEPAAGGEGAGRVRGVGVRAPGEREPGAPGIAEEGRPAEEVPGERRERGPGVAPEPAGPGVGPGGREGGGAADLGVPAAEGAERGERGGAAGRAGAPVEEAPPAPRPAAADAEDGGIQLLNYRISDADKIGEGGKGQKWKDLIRALETLRAIEQEGRPATAKEQKALIRFPGWGWTANILHPKNAEPNAPAHYQYSQIAKLLSPEEMNAARAGALNSHFTSPSVIRAIWQALSQLGFRQGRILEPAAGIGLFYGLMPDQTEGSSLYAIEKDSLSGKMLQQLYQRASVRVGGFEDTRLADGSFDVAVSNVPFGNFAVSDAALQQKLGLTGVTRRIHNYFFAKAMEKLRPGGIMAFISSHGTLDANDIPARQTRAYLAREAKLLGAIRLPNTAFQKNALTQVTTDIIFLQKRLPGDVAPGEAFQEIARVADEEGKAIFANEYFAAHPEMVLGQHSLKGTMYARQGEGEYTVLPAETDLEPALSDAIFRLPRDVYTGWSAQLPEPAPAEGALEPTARPLRLGAIRETPEGALVQMTAEGAVAVEGEKAQLGALRLYVRLRDALTDLIESQRGALSAEAVGEKQARLKALYQDMVKRHQPLHRQTKALWRSDPEAPVVLALERWDTRKRKVTALADIFTKRLVPDEPVTSAASPADALLVTLRERGRVEGPRLAELTGQPEYQVLAELARSGAIFYDRQAKLNGQPGWVVAEDYGSGNTRRKLDFARAELEALERGAGETWAETVLTASDLREQIAFLEAHQPRDIAPERLSIKPGAAWVQPEVYQEFLEHVLKVRRGQLAVAYSTPTSKWRIAQERRYRWEAGRVATHENLRTYGTEEYRGHELFELLMNGQVPTVRQEIEKGKTVVDLEATANARARQNDLRAAWQTWVRENPGRLRALADHFNRTVNVIRTRTYDGSFLTFAGMNPVLKLRAHQKNAIWRMLQSPATLLAHDMGTGKTYTIIAAVMEMRRIGLRRRPMVAVPTTGLGQFERDFRAAYPGARLLVYGGELAANREEFMARAATGEWDAIIVSHDALNLLPSHPSTVQAFFEEQINGLRGYLFSLRREIDQTGESTSRDWSVKEVERAIKSLEGRMKAKLAALEARGDDALFWEDLGIDHLVVDESHAYKNLMYASRREGLGSAGSDRAFSLYIKTSQLLQSGGGLTFSSGTPLTNSMAEMHGVMRFLAPDLLRERGLQEFDAWAQAFAEQRTVLERSITGAYQNRSRLQKFSNLSAVMAMYRTVADGVSTEQVGEIELPPLQDAAGNPTDKPIIVQAGVNAHQRALYVGLAERAERLRGKRKFEKGEENPLSLSTEARRATLDIRLVEPKAPDYQDSKINMVVEKLVAEHFRPENVRDRRTQLVFLDMGVPGSKFDLYADLRQKLIRAGVAPDEIATVYDAKNKEQQEALFDRLNDGRIRILMGSRAKLGIGVNVQRRLVAGHQVDPTWRPDQIEQADARVVRHGNEFAEQGVRLYQYVLPNTFDAFMWDKIAAKARWIQAARRGEVPAEEMEDLSMEETFSLAEVQAVAAGNPEVAELVRLETRIGELSREERGFQDQQQSLRGELRDIRETLIPLTEKDLARAQEALAYRQGQPKPEAGKWTAVIEGKTYTSRTDAASAVTGLFEAQGVVADWREVGTYRGYRAEARLVQREPLTVEVGLGRAGLGWGQHDVTAKLERGQSFIRIENVLEGLDEDVHALEDRLARMRGDIPRIEQEVARAWPGEADLEQANRRRQELQERIGLQIEHGGAAAGVWGQELVPMGQAVQAVAETEVPGPIYADAEPLADEVAVDPAEPDQELFGRRGAVAAPPGAAVPGPLRRPRPLTPVSPTGQKAASDPVSQRDVVLEIVKATGQPHRQGRLRGAAAIAGGAFARLWGVSRAKNMYDVTIALHEQGHGLSDRFGWDQAAAMAPELDRLGDPNDLGIHSSWKQGQAARKRRREGVAEGTRLWLQEPDALRQAAPLFNEKFERALEQDGMLAGFQTARQTWERYVGQDGRQKLIADTDHAGAVGRMWRLRYAWTGFRQEMLDDLFAVRRITERIFGKRYEDIPPTQNPYAWTRTSRGALDWAYQIITEGTEAGQGLPTVSGLRAIRQMSGDTSEGAVNFQTYLQARMLKTWLQVSKAEEAEGKPGRGTAGRSAEEIDEIIGGLETPDFRKAADEWNRYHGFLLDVGSDFATPEAIAEWKARGFYCPLTRAMEAGVGELREEFPTGAGAKFANQRVWFQRYLGESRRPFIPPFEATVQRTYNVVTRYWRNMAMKAVVRMLEGNERYGKMIEEVPADLIPHSALAELKAALTAMSETRRQHLSLEELFDSLESLPEEAFDLKYWQRVTRLTNGQRVERIVFMMDQGRPRFFQMLDTPMYESLLAMAPETRGLLAQIIGLPAQTLRLGVTFDPAFTMYANLLRDTVATFMVNDGAFVPVWDTLKGAEDVILDTDTKKSAIRYGLGLAGTGALDRATVRARVEKVLRSTDTLAGKVETVVDNTRRLRDASEMATRIGAYRRELERSRRVHKGWTEADHHMWAVLRARDLLDFAMRGRLTSQITFAIPFARSALNGLAKVTHEATRDPRKILWRGGLVAIATAALYGLNRRDRDYWEQPEYTRNNNWLIKVPGTHDFVKIPIPFEWGWAFKTMVENHLRALADHDEHAYDRAIRALREAALPDFIQIWELSMDLAANWQSYVERPIAPDYLVHGPSSVRPGLQAGPSTSPAAKVIGRALEISPAKIQYAARETGGPLAAYAQTLVDWMLVPLTGEKPRYSNNPLRRIITTVNPYPWLYDELQRKLRVLMRAENSIRLFEDPAEQAKEAHRWGLGTAGEVEIKRKTLAAALRDVRMLEEQYYAEGRKEREKYEIRRRIQQAAARGLRAAGFPYTAAEAER